MKRTHNLVKYGNLALRTALPFSRKLPTRFNGHWIWLSRKSWTSVYLDYEPHIAEALKSGLSRGDTFWDIGAHIGLHSLFASIIIGRHGKVFSFEPSPDVFTVLKGNTFGNKNIQLFQRGISSTDGISLFAAHGTSASGSFVEEVTEVNRHYHPNEPIRKVRVETRKLDTLLSELRPPSLIKIDVEGFELKVLKGSERLLSDVRPMLIIEIHPGQLILSGGSEEAIFNILKRHCYEWKVIDRNPNSLYTVLAQPH